MRYLLLSVLVIFAIGLFVVEDAFGESIIKEKDCVKIGKELDSNIKCRIVLTENIGSPFYHDQERDILYFGNSHDYTGRDWDSLNILIPRVSCDPVTTGTYVETTTYPCELQIEEKPKPRYLATTYGRIGSFIQEEKDVIFAEVQRYYDSDFGSWAKSWMALYNHDGQFIRWLDDYHSHGTGMDSHACDYPNPRLSTCANLKHKFVQQSKTEVPYIYYVVTSGERYRDTAGSKGLGIGLHVIKGTGTFPDIHSYKTDIGGSGKIYLNEDKNELYYFSKFRESEDGSIQAYRGDTLIYQINGMGELKSAATFTTTEPKSTAEPEQMTDKQPVASSPTCGKGTILKNGVCVVEEKSKGGGCLIATATFGSEMAPQVQFLRELRDNTVLQTESGTSFMAGFNQFYYSFSPAIADYERENPAFKEVVKITLTPLLTSLTLLQYADIDSESEMLGYGIGVILLNIGMYFVAPTVLIMTVRKRI